MYLSMWILAESLKDYDIDTHIISGEMCIRNASLLFSSDRFQPHTVGSGKRRFCGGKESRQEDTENQGKP